MTMDPVDQFAQRVAEINKPTPKRATGWASLNAIQKSGIIASCIVYVSSFFFSDTTRAYVEVCAQTCLLFGWVAGAFWKVRHALHFWWSLLIVALGHLCVLPFYVRVNRYYETGHHFGREVATVQVGMIAIETLIFIFLLKKVAMLIHGRSSQHSENQYGRI